MADTATVTVLVLEIDSSAVSAVVAAVPTGSASFGGQFSSLDRRAAGIAGEIAARQARESARG
jgi:hypothetical protein